VDRTGENRLAPGQDHGRCVAVPPNVPVVTAAVCGRTLSWRKQTLLTDRSRRFERKDGSVLLNPYEASNNKLR